MNSKLKLALIVLAAVIALAIIVAIVVFSFAGASDEPDVSASPAAPSTQTPSTEPTPQPTEQTDPEQGEAGTTTATIAVGGDIVMHTGLNTEALTADGTYDYTPIFGASCRISYPGPTTPSARWCPRWQMGESTPPIRSSVLRPLLRAP